MSFAFWQCIRETLAEKRMMNDVILGQRGFFFGLIRGQMDEATWSTDEPSVKTREDTREEPEMRQSEEKSNSWYTD